MNGDAVESALALVEILDDLGSFMYSLQGGLRGRVVALQVRRDLPWFANPRNSITGYSCAKGTQGI